MLYDRLPSTRGLLTGIVKAENFSASCVLYEHLLSAPKNDGIEKKTVFLYENNYNCTLRRTSLLVSDRGKQCPSSHTAPSASQACS